MTFLAEGYEIVNLFPSTASMLEEARTRLTRIMGGEPEDYHLRVFGEQEVTQEKALAALCDLPRRVVESELTYFRRLIGTDLHIQQKPFLRISRPGNALDNIGFHRDTWYGDTPYEISVWVPLTDTDDGNCLYIATGSHLWSESAHPTERFARPDVKQGSLKHSLGLIYDPPKRLQVPVPMTPLPVKVGQMIVFSLAALHGQEVNASKRTRVSMDVRLTNSLAPVAMSRSRNPNYYERLCCSQVTQAALKYKEAQECSPSP